VTDLFTPHDTLLVLGVLTLLAIAWAWSRRIDGSKMDPKECETLQFECHELPFDLPIDPQDTAWQGFRFWIDLEDVDWVEIMRFEACTYAEHFAAEEPPARLRSLPAWDAVHQRRANVTQPLNPAERPW
jgi:hypothetical protein